jgi:ABC-type transporter Mla subunit MlaD
MKASRLTDALLGVVFFGSLIGLGITTIVLSDVKFGVPHYDVDFISPDVGYLRPGDPVLVYGMPSGKVQTIDRLPASKTVTAADGTPAECRVKVRARMELDLYSNLPKDSTIVVEDRGLLGGKLVRIEKGMSDTLWQRDEPLLLIERRSALETAGDVFSENRENVRRTIDNLAQVAEAANHGTGVIGMLLHDEQSANDARGLLADARGSAAEIRAVAVSLHEGKGLLGALLADQQLADDVRKIVKHALGAIEDARESTPVQSFGSFLFGTF